MAQVVQIEVVVDEKGAVQGIRTIGRASQQTTAEIKNLGSQMTETERRAIQAFNSAAEGAKKSGASMSTAIAAYVAMGKKGEEVQARLGAAFDAAKSKGASFTEALRMAVAEIKAQDAAAKQASKSLMGMGESYGVARIGAAALTGSFSSMGMGLARIIASNKALAGLWEAALPIAVGAGMVGILADVGVELYHVYEKYFDVTAAARAYNKEVQKAQFEAFGNTRSIEETTQRIREATRTVEYYKAAVASGQKNASTWQGIPMFDGTTFGINPLLNPYSWHEHNNATKASQNQEKYQGAIEKLRLAQGAQHHQAILDAIQESYTPTPGMSESQKIRLRYNESIATNAENQKWLVAQSGEHGNSAVANAGRAHEQALDTVAKKQKENELYGIQREHRIELRHLEEQGLQASLHGIALFEAQKSAAIKNLEDQDIDATTAEKAVHDLFHQRELNYLADEAREIDHMSQTAAAAGLTGVARIRAEGSIRNSDISDDRKYSHAEKDAATKANQEEVNAQIAASEQNFTDRVNALVQDSASRSLKGFARIRAEADRQFSEFQQQFTREYGKNPNNADYQAHAGELAKAKSAIYSGAQDQAAELARQNTDETESIEQQARARQLQAEGHQTAAIAEQYEARTEKLKQQLDEQQISWDDYNRRVAAAQEEMYAQMTEAAKREREKLAGEMRGLMGAHPLRGLEEIGTKQASEAGAALWQRAAGHFHVGTPSTGKWWSKLAGGQSTNSSFEPELMHRTSLGSHDSAMHLATATIYVASARILGGGAPGVSSPSSAGGFESAVFHPSSSGSSGYSGWTGGGGASPLFRRASYSIGPGAGISSSSWAAGGSSPAGSVPAGSASGSFTSGSAGYVAPKGPGALGYAQDTISTLGTVNSIGAMMHGGGSGSSSGLEPTDNNPTGHLDANGNYVSGGSSKMISNSLGAAGAGLGLFAAHKEGGLGGTLSGAMSGAKIGMMVGGPIGAGVGALAGAAIGFFGGGEQARLWWLKQGQPRMYNDMDAYEQGSMDYLSAYTDLQALDAEARNTLKKMGFQGVRYFSDTVEGELKNEIQKLTREQKSGRSASGFSAAQYDTGGLIDSFGDFGTSGDHGFVHAERGEFMMRPQIYNRYPDAFHRLNAGQSLDSIASSYRTAMQPSSSRRPIAASSSQGVHLHFHSPDAKGARDLLMANAMHVRAALNKSKEEYGGESDG